VISDVAFAASYRDNRDPDWLRATALGGAFVFVTAIEGVVTIFLFLFLQSLLLFFAFFPAVSHRGSTFFVSIF
jgi:hypothetical protein